MGVPPEDDGTRFLLVVLIVALVGGGVVAAMLTGRKESKVNPAAALVAVFPLRAEDDDTALARLGRAVATASALTLRDVPEVGTVDPAAILAVTSGRGVDRARADSLARRLGASSYVYGEIERDGGRIRVELSLRSTARGGPAAELIVGAPEGDFALLADSVTWAVLRRLYRGHNMPRPRTRPL
jgi:TolB-like protein